MIKKTIILAMCLASSVAVADCHIRSNIKLSRQKIDFGPTDIQRIVTPDAAGSKCALRYRVNIGDEWQTAEGIGRGATEAEACTQAMDFRQGALLSEVKPTRVTADTQMVCSDLEDIRIRTVKIGEVIWESETDMHRHQDERKYFDYKQTQCRMFTERNVKDRNLYTYQGLICKVNSTPNSKWRVVDKY